MSMNYGITVEVNKEMDIILGKKEESQRRVGLSVEIEA
jgi:hypothetical protein